MAEQHELFQQVLRRNVISRRSILRGGIGAAGAAFLLGGSLSNTGTAFADTLSNTGTVADGFVVNGRHLSFGPDPERQMWVAGQLFNLNTYNAVPSGVKVQVQYGYDETYGRVATAELRELITHVPVWNGVATGPVTASTTDLLNADQFYVHALLDDLEPGQTYHYRFVYFTRGGNRGYTPDATFTTAPRGRGRLKPFTFTAYGDADHQGPQPAQRHPLAVHPAGRRHLLRQPERRRAADHQPRRNRRQPAGSFEHPRAAGEQRRLG